MERITEQNLVEDQIETAGENVLTFTLYATRTDIPPIQKDFIIEVKDEKLLFYPA